MNISTINLLSTEFRKLKNTPVVYLVGCCILFVITVITLAHILDIANTAIIGVNPWNRLLATGFGLFSFFVAVPFVVFLITAVTYVEQRANSWKLLYTMPISRGNFYFSKLFVILIIVISAAVLLVCALLLVGLILSCFYPELEFTYYQPNISELSHSLIHSLVAVLGVLGIHYFLSLWLKNFIASMSIGIVGYILAFILASTNTKFVLFLPYSYVMIVKDFGIMKNEFPKELFNSGFMNVEFYSLGCFLVFICLGYILERKRNVA